VDWPLVNCNGPALCVSDICPLGNCVINNAMDVRRRGNK
jgi:hypothetical protein